jgi:hypothetical protein
VSVRFVMNRLQHLRSHGRLTKVRGFAGFLSAIGITKLEEHS